MRDPSEQRDAVLEFLVTTAALRCGIFEKMAEAPYDAAGLARVTGLDRRATSRLLRALEHYEVVHQTPFGYALTPAGAAAYRPGSGTARYTQLLAVDTTKGLLHLPDIVRTGEHVTPKDDPVRLRNFIYAQAERPDEPLDRAAQLFLDGLPEGAHIVDLGGGPGHMARRFLDAGHRVTVVDLPDVIDLVADDLGGIDGIRLVAADVTHGWPDALTADGPIDAIYLGNLTNMFSETQNAALFQEIGRHLRPGGCVGVQVQLGGHSTHAEVFQVMMLAFTPGGDAWPLERYEHWFGAAGLAAPVAHDLDAEQRYQILLGERPPER